MSRLQAGNPKDGSRAALPYVNMTGPRKRGCPRCGAKSGWSCIKLVAGIENPMKTVHKERKGPRGSR